MRAHAPLIPKPPPESHMQERNFFSMYAGMVHASSPNRAPPSTHTQGPRRARGLRLTWLSAELRPPLHIRACFADCAKRHGTKAEPHKTTYRIGNHRAGRDVRRASCAELRWTLRASRRLGAEMAARPLETRECTTRWLDAERCSSTRRSNHNGIRSLWGWWGYVVIDWHG